MKRVLNEILRYAKIKITLKGVYAFFSIPFYFFFLRLTEKLKKKEVFILVATEFKAYLEEKFTEGISPCLSLT